MSQLHMKVPHKTAGKLMPHSALQLAAAAEFNQAEESQALSRLADSGFSSSSAVATAVHNCRYRPYIARQVTTSLTCTLL